MVGREIASLHLDTSHQTGAVLLDVEGLCVPRREGTSLPALTKISFQLRQGEILGVAGLLGSGRTELLEALFVAFDNSNVNL